MKQINLNRREKHILAGAACFIVIFLVFKLVISPLVEKKELLNQKVAKKTVELEEIRAFQNEFKVLQKKSDLARASLSRRDRNFSLFSFLDDLNGEIGMNVSSMKPDSSFQKDTNLKISTVQLKLQAITLEQLTKYLHRVEYSNNNIVVRLMNITETENPAEYIDVQLQVETIEM